MLKGGGGVSTSFEVVLTQELEVLAILMGGAKSVHPFKKGGATTMFTLVREVGVQSVLDPRFPHFVAPPTPRN